MANVLLVDTNVSSAPIYQFLVGCGFNVYVVGRDKNDFLAKCAANYIQQDYSTEPTLEKLCEELNIQYLVPGCNDLSYEVCAEIAEKKPFFGFDLSKISNILNNKMLFRSFANQNSIPVPQVWCREEILKSCFPIIVKPTDSYSGKGVTVIKSQNAAELEVAINLAEQNSRSGSYVIEEFVVGQLYSHSCFIEGERIVQDFIVEEHCTANPYAVDTSRVVTDLPSNLRDELRRSVGIMANELGLKDGLIHTQFITNRDSVWLIEVTRRCPGDLYSQLIEMATSFPYVESYVSPFLNRSPSNNCIELCKNRVMRHTVSSPSTENFWTLELKTPIKIKKFVPQSLAGDQVEAAPRSRVGILFAEADSDEEFEILFEKTKNRELYILN